MQQWTSDPLCHQARVIIREDGAILLLEAWMVRMEKQEVHEPKGGGFTPNVTLRTAQVPAAEQ